MLGLKRARRDVLHDSRKVGAVRWHPCHLRKNPHQECRVYVSRRGKKTLVVHVKELKSARVLSGLRTFKSRLEDYDA